MFSTYIKSVLILLKKSSFENSWFSEASKGTGYLSFKLNPTKVLLNKGWENIFEMIKTFAWMLFENHHFPQGICSQFRVILSTSLLFLKTLFVKSTNLTLLESSWMLISSFKESYQWWRNNLKEFWNCAKEEGVMNSHQHSLNDS